MSLTTSVMQAAVPGLTPGELSVGQSGAAEYNVPIAVPPGTAGMAPILSLNYSSNSGNGPLGVGWSLSGLSAITRCPQTLAQDGQIRAVKFDTQDKFCLDGQRLVVSNGGAYGANGTQYRTEMDNFSLITSHGSGSGSPVSGPNYFTVKTKAGQTMFYGTTTDSNIDSLNGGHVRTWALNQLHDTVGNYINFTYEEDTDKQDYRIARIDYTGNVNGRGPYSSVRFAYMPRPRLAKGYIAGHPFAQRKLMTNIKTYAGETQVKDYRLHYEMTGVVGQPRIEEIKECDGGGQCFNPLTFDWSPELFGFVGAQSLADVPLKESHGFQWVDHNGDGKTDFCYIAKSNELRCHLSTSTLDGGNEFNRTPVRSASTIDKGYEEGREWVDVNGDGRVDFCRLVVDGSSNKYMACNASTGNGFNNTFYSSILADGGGQSEGRRWVDFNGDGRADFCRVTGSSSAACTLSTGTGFGQTIIGTGLTYGTGANGKNIRDWEDVNGDGLVDFCRTLSDKSKTCNFSTGSGFDLTPHQTAANTVGTSLSFVGGTNPNQNRWIDFNGDGNKDLCVVQREGGERYSEERRIVPNLGYPIHHNIIGEVTYTTKCTLFTGVGFAPIAIESEPLVIPEQYCQGRFCTPEGLGVDFKWKDVNNDGLGDVCFRVDKGRSGCFFSEGHRFHSLMSVTGIVFGDSRLIDANFADVNGDAIADACYVRFRRNPDNDDQINCNIGNTRPQMRIIKVTNSLGSPTEIEYKPMTDSSVYSKSADVVPKTTGYPYLDVQAPMYVVSKVKNDNGLGLGITNDVDYTYAGAKVHLKGRGFAGFRWMFAYNRAQGTYAATEFHQDFPLAGMVAYTRSNLIADNSLISQTNNTYNVVARTDGSYFPYLQTSNQVTYELGGAMVKQTVTDYVYDDYGNPISIKVATAGLDQNTFRTETTNTYDASSTAISKWYLGRLTTTAVTQTANGKTATRKSAFEYDINGHGMLMKEIIEPNNPALRLETAYQYDAYGNKTRVTALGGSGSTAITARSTRTEYSGGGHNTGQFPIKITNAMGESETHTYDARFGVMTKLTGPNGLETTWQYDSFGRKIKETRADSTTTTFTRNWCAKYCKTSLTTQSTGSAPALEAFDRLGRIQYVNTYGLGNDLSGSNVYTDLNIINPRIISVATQYNIRGEIKRTSQPFYLQSPIHWTNFTYDALGRPLTETDANGTTGYEYKGLTSTLTNRLNQKTTRRVNARDELIQTTDNLGFNTYYQYDAQGNQTQVTDHLGNITTIDYDARGRKIAMNDPDMGDWEYSYNALGELISQTDAKGQITRMEYDILGRMITRTDAECNSFWVYGSHSNTGASDKAIGKLIYSQKGQQEKIFTRYDSLGRPNEIETRLQFEATNKTYLTQTNYDTLGRVQDITYPASNDYPTGLVVRNHYDANGHMHKVTGPNNITYWQATKQNARGQITEFRMGNGATETQRSYNAINGLVSNINTRNDNGTDNIQKLGFTFDVAGNLKTRRGYDQGNNTNLEENFHYDGINRLIVSQLGDGSHRKQYDYDALGNLTFKTGVGTYDYTNGRPHAVSNTSIGSKQYQYDDNGNMMSGDGRTITWSPYNKPIKIEKDGVQTATQFDYGANRNRIRQVNDQKIIYYVNGLFEQEYDGTTTTDVHYIKAGGSTIAIVKSKGTNDPLETRYLHKDHLGGIESITNEQGNLVQQFSYDPHGKRRAVNWTDDDNVSNPAIYQFDTQRGFTGHEHLDEVGLIHMNGRVYDPTLGRFISADPFVQFPDNGQSLNRYSYVLNNPLSYSDPSGFLSLGFLKKAFKVVASYFIAVIPGVNVFVAGFLIGFLNGGTLKSGFIGAVTMGAFQKLGGAGAIAGKIGGFTGDVVEVVAHGVVGGVSAIARGGRFIQGFLPAGLSSATSLSGFLRNLDDVTQGFAQAVIGGTASVLGGGKFANGAITGAFVYAAGRVGQASADGNICSRRPINIATGEKYLTMLDYKAAGASQLKFERYYSSHAKEKTSLGYGWRSNFDKKLRFEGVAMGIPWKVIYTKTNREEVVFSQNDEGNWITSSDTLESLQKTEAGWQLTDASGTVETFNTDGQFETVEKRGGYQQALSYNDNGQLVQVTDSFNVSLNFTYNRKGLLESMSDPEGNVTHYRYNHTKQVLAQVLYPDETETLADNPYKRYFYRDKRFPTAITGIENELGQRIHSMAYDGQGRAILSELGDSGERVDIVFHKGVNAANKSSTVRNSLGRETKYFFDADNRPLSVEGHATKTCIASNQGYTYDENGNIETKTDWNGVVTRYQYNDRNLEILRIEAEGTDSERVVTTSWHPHYRIPTQVVAPGNTTEFDYDQRGLLTKRTERDTLSARTAWQELLSVYPERVTTYAYNAQGLVEKIDGPLTGEDDVLTFAYDAMGNRTQVNNSLGHQSETRAFDQNGRPLLVVDANGVETHLEYNARGWLARKTIKGNDGEATTQYEYAHSGTYEGQGLISKVTLPNQKTVNYDYDSAYKLIGLHNSQGERIEYTLDLEGNRIAETTFNASNELVRTQRRVFDELSRLLSSIGADQQTTRYHYDKNGNLTGRVDPLNNETHYAFDALNRLIATTDANDGVVATAYNGQGQVTSVTDQRGLTTEYHYNGFGEKVAQISPDTGKTVFDYNKAGQLIKQIDAREIETQYHYDAIGRVTQIHYPAANDDDIYYAYDQQRTGTDHAIGQLTEVTDPAGTTEYGYNQHGQVNRQDYTLGGVAYHTQNHYNAAGELTAMTYPSGRVVNYQHDNLGRIQGVTTQASATNRAQTVVNHLDYHAFGPVSQMDYGNGAQINIDRDKDYRVTHIRVTDSNNDVAYYDAGYHYDDASNIKQIDDQIETTDSQTFDYDALYRLTRAEGQYGQIDYDYDGVGNRLERRLNDKLSDTDTLDSLIETYDYAHDSNRLISVAKQKGQHSTQRSLDYDPVGNIIHDSRSSENNLALNYGANNRLQQVDKQTEGETTSAYVYNAKNQRVIKTVTQADGSQTTTHFHYNALDQLIAETSNNGAVFKEYLYAGGTRVAMVDYAQDNAGQLVFIHNDHLGTPKLMTDGDMRVVWQAQSLPFGETRASVADVKQSLRFPGQYKDEETGYHYNYHRDYDPTLGRYIQSDPIGLLGGVNTFGYVGGNPVTSFDPKGLVEWTGRVEYINAGQVAGTIRARFFLESEAVKGVKWRVRVNAAGSGSVIGKGPYAVSASKITFNDGLTSTGPTVFEGNFVMANAGFSTPLGGVTYGGVILGNAASKGFSFSIGIEVPGALDMHGESSLVSAEQIFVEDENQQLMCP